VPSRRVLFVPLALLAIALLAVAVLTWRGAAPEPPRAPTVIPEIPGGEVAVLVGAGDIARCDSDADEATAELLDRIGGTVFTAGDNAYERGTPDEFARCYDPTWGRHLERTRFPAAGNHDWETPDAAGYLGYFGAAARPDGTTWYSGELGEWHVVVLDSDCEAVGGCDDGSPQLEWLRRDLAASDDRCAVAIFHHPRFSSGQHGSYTSLDALWRALYEGGVEVAISGHDHNYERFAAQDGDGRRDDSRGVRQFVIGTGGTHLRDLRDALPNSEVRHGRTHGVLRLSLAPATWQWDFVPVAGGAFSDAGTGACH
jgi:hypothetical protein